MRHAEALGVGSPDLENAHLFGFWCSNPHAKNVQANGCFCLLAKGSKFSKGALRAVGAIAFVAAGGGTFHVRRRRCTSKLLLTARCAAQASLCCLCSSSAASTSAVGWSSRRLAQEQEQRKRSIGKKLHSFCLLYTSPSPRDGLLSRMPSSA